MAKVRTSAISGGTSGTTNRTVAITAAIGDLIVVFGAVSGVSAAATCSDGGTGGTYTSVLQKLFNTSADAVQVFVRDNLVTAAGSITVTYATGANVSAEVCAVAISGMSKTGASAIFQSGGQANQAAASTPAPVLTNAPKTYNLMLSAVGSDNTVAGPTKPATFTLQQSAGQVTNNIWLAVASQDKGFTSATTTWASTCATVYGSLVVELDASPWSPIQNGTATTASATTLNLVLGAVPTTGNFVAVGAVFGVAISNLTVKDSNNNSYTIAPHNGSNGQQRAFIAYLLSAPANATATITASWTTSSNADLIGQEFDPCGGTPAFDTDIAGSGASGTSINTPTITPSAAGALAFACAETNTTISAPTATTKLGSWWGSGVSNGNAAEYALGISAATAVQMTQTTSAWASTAASFLQRVNVTVSVTGSALAGTSGSVVGTGGAIVSPTGVAVAATSGSPTITGTAVVSPTGSALAATSGSPTISGAANVSPSGLALAITSGSVTVSVAVDVNVSVTGNALTVSVGTPTISGGASVSPTGTALAVTSGSPTISGGASASPTGSALAVTSGSPSVAAGANVSPTGAALTASSGTPTVSGGANVSPTGTALTVTSGSPSIAAGANVSVSGNALTVTVGTPTVSGSASVSPTGGAIVATSGSVAVVGSASVNVTGNGLSIVSGDVAIAANAVVQAVGSALQAFVGSPVVSGDAMVAAIGSAIQAAVGSVTVSTGVNVTVMVTGSPLSVDSGDVTVHTSSGVSVIVTVTGSAADLGGGQVTVQTSDIQPFDFPVLPGSEEFDSISFFNPSQLPFYHTGKQYFSWPGVISKSIIGQPIIATADGSNLLGFWKMPNQLLSISGSGRISRQTYTINASGYITAPFSGSDMGFNITLDQNYFSNPHPDGTANSIIVARDIMAQMSSPVSVSPAAALTWAMTCRLTGGGRNEGYILSSYSVTVGGVTNVGNAVSNRQRTEPIIQLSIGVDFTGTLTNQPFEAFMTQFILRRGV